MTHFSWPRALAVLLCALMLTAGGLACKKPEHPEHAPADHAGPHGHDEKAPKSAEHHDESEEHHHGEGHHEESIQVDEAALKRGDVRTELVGTSPVSAQIKVPAEVHFNPDRLAHVTPIVPGQIVEAYVNLGDTVSQGDRLAKFRSVEFGRARSELKRAQAMASVAEAALGRQRELRELGIASERNFLEAQQTSASARAELEAARSQLKVLGASAGSGADDIIRAPIAGTIIERHATRGEYVGPQDKLFVVGDLSEVWVLGRVPADQIDAVALGAPTRISLREDTAPRWSGTIDYIASQVDEQTRTLEVRTALKNTDLSLRPGRFGTMHIQKPTAPSQDKNVLSVPTSALQKMGGEEVVFVVVGDAFRPVPVLTGTRAGGRVEILEGLKPGQSIVVQGAFLLKSQSMREELGGGHAH